MCPTPHFHYFLSLPGAYFSDLLFPVFVRDCPEGTSFLSGIIDSTRPLRPGTVACQYVIHAKTPTAILVYPSSCRAVGIYSLYNIIVDKELCTQNIERVGKDAYRGAGGGGGG